jgi:CubicO group peptidase (beta-lactamase class C family)
MRMARMAVAGLVAVQLAACSPPLRPARTLADNEVQRVMKREGVQGLAIATIENGKVAKVRAFGTRNAALGLPLTPDTVMYGASLTKTAFCYMLLQMADEGLIDLDAPVSRLLPRPLPSYRDKPFDFADSRRRPALAHDHAAHADAAQRRLRQLPLARTGRQAAHALRPRQPLRLFRRGLLYPADDRRARPEAGPGAEMQRACSTASA